MRIRSVEHSDLPQLLALYRFLNPDDPETELSDAVRKLDSLRAISGSDIFAGRTSRTSNPSPKNAAARKQSLETRRLPALYFLCFESLRCDGIKRCEGRDAYFKRIKASNYLRMPSSMTDT